MKTAAYLMHGLTPIHAGVGQGVGHIDLPIAREKVNNHGFIPATTVKGVLRDGLRVEGNYAEASEDESKERYRYYASFGPDTANASEHSGALLFTDARLLLLPVRALRGTFAWVTSPITLMRFARDLAEAGMSLPPVDGPDNVSTCLNALGGGPLVHNGQVFLEELDLKVSPSKSARQWSQLIGKWLFPDDQDWQKMLAERLLIVHEEAFDFLSETATQIDTRVRIDEETGTVAQGQLWTEEALPAETILFGLLAAQEPTRGGRGRKKLSSGDLLSYVESSTRGRRFQMGGKASVGRGQVLLHVKGGAS